MSVIPEDVLLDVLSRLPAVSLVRFKCASKSWCALIDSSYLIQLHLKKSLNDIKSRKMLAVGKYHRRKEDNRVPVGFIFYVISFDFGFKIADVQEMKPPVQHCNDRVSIIGSSRFLICLRYTFQKSCREKIVLWNPSIGSHRILPFTPVEIEALEARKYGHYTFSYGFGHDNVTDDHQVARFVLDNYNGDYEVKVYSLKLDSWKKIENIPLISIFRVSRPSFADGSMKWLVQDKQPNSTFSLLVLCLRTEVLRSVSLPEGFKMPRLVEFCSYCRCWTNWSVYRNCFSHDCDLWKSLGNENSDIWTKLRLPHSDADGGMVFSDIYQHLKESLSKNLHSESIKISSGDTCCWVESLVQVKRRSKKIRERASQAQVEKSKKYRSSL